MRSLVIRGVLPIEVTDIWAATTEVTDDMPSHADAEGVEQLLQTPWMADQ